MRVVSSWFVLAAAVGSFVVGCAGAPPPKAVAPVQQLDADRQIITAEEATSERELVAYAERAMRERRFADAAHAYELLIASGAREAEIPGYLYNLGNAYEGLGERAKARTAYRDLAKRAPDGPYARSALVRAIDLHAYLEEWAELDTAGAELLARTDIANIERVLGLGAQSLAKVETGNADAAAHDIQVALDIVEELRLGEGGRLPSAVAQLKFAHAELRRIKAERIELAPVDAHFGGRLEARCQGLLDAQTTYAQAMHAQDPHWAAMAGYRVGDMYRVLHVQVMALPAPGPVKTENDRQILFASMHLRYRILLDKALKMLNGTLDLAEKVSDGSAWVGRTQATRDEIEKAIATEKATIATFPFTEEEMQAAVKLLIERGEKGLPPPKSAKTPPAKTAAKGGGAAGAH